MKSKLLVLTLKGSPHQIGYDHGKKARSEIEHNLEVYFRRFKSETELSHDVAVSRAAKFLEVINKVSPEYAETMKDRKSTRLNSSHQIISYAVFCLKKKKKQKIK